MSNRTPRQISHTKFHVMSHRTTEKNCKTNFEQRSMKSQRTGRQKKVWETNFEQSKTRQHKAWHPLARGGGAKLTWTLVFYVTCNNISVIYVTAHRCAGGLKKLYLRSDSTRLRHFVGLRSLTCPSKHRHGAILCIRLFRETTLFHWEEHDKKLFSTAVIVNEDTHSNLVLGHCFTGEDTNIFQHWE